MSSLDPKTPLAEVVGGGSPLPRYVCTHCTNCGFNNFPPAEICPKCWSTATTTNELSEEGILYSFSSTGGEGGKQYVGYVDLPEEIRVFGLLETRERPICGVAVRLSSVRLPQGSPAFVFNLSSKVES